MTNLRTGVAIPAALTFAAALFWGVAADAYYAGGGKDAAKGNDCLIGYDGVDPDQITLDEKGKSTFFCKDCDPTCDHDGVATANGSCLIEIGVCINQSGVEGCEPPSALNKAKAKGKVKGVKGSGGKIIIDTSQLLEGSACGALVDVTIPLKDSKQGLKDRKASLMLSASVKKNKTEGTPKRSDKDKLTIVCQPLAEGESCPVPSTTVTTTSTSTTTSTVKPCGNGSVDAGEECDYNAEPTGCPGGDTCIPDCTCATGCVPPSAGETGLTFTTSTGTTQCGSPGFFPTVAAAPFAGTLSATSCTCATADDCTPPGSLIAKTCVQGHCTVGAPNRIACTGNTDCAAGQACEDYTIDLGLSCLYIGGGNSTVPGGATPNDAPNTFGVDLVCDGGDTLALGGGDTGDPKTCTLEDGPTKYCANGNPGLGGTGACDSDADCRPNCQDVVCHDGGPNDGQPCDPTDTAFCAQNQCYGDCVNGAPGRPDGHCVSGAQCGSGSEGCIDITDDGVDDCAGIDGLVCVPTANCYFGPPLPVRNGAISTCVLNVFDTDAHGVAHKAAGEVTVGYTLSSRVFFTGITYTPQGSTTVQPCPVCVDGTCNFGPNKDQPCVGVGNDGTTQDCPPDGYFFLAPLSVTLDPLTTGTSSQAADTPEKDGFFCPFQTITGAFKAPSARVVTMQGSPTASALSGTPQDATLASAFCIPKTGSVVIDGAANLPGPGGTTLPGTLQLQ